MSTSKQYPYFGACDDVGNKASVIVQFTAPKTGTVVWTSDPDYHKVGDFGKDWFEPNFVPITDPFTVAYLKKAFNAATTALADQQLYILLETEGNIPDTVSYDIDTLKEEARKQTDSGYLTWDQFGDTWNGRDRDQNDASWEIRPVKLV